ncbi:DUF982 domain-containing protein [Rhizobium ruizarguesonis]|uniref:DUF982 domain-containing protein n=1 Tax=Rhizobium ruizarguesonis TaxID=2081791 RepID=UPI0010308C6F|nr:DUF982 domain-containing protein [Rhizobium ruizarguesonis]TBD47113.1 DUF982 domain-containing protein [Rhizobium ruizarguesonis]
MSMNRDETSAIVRTLREAAYLLIREWRPSSDGEEYVTAVKACVDAVNGDIGPDQFRAVLLRYERDYGCNGEGTARKDRRRHDGLQEGSC